MRVPARYASPTWMAVERLGRGLVVLGMHRSGTSAVTGAIAALGIPACRPEDRYPPRRWNARGNYESRSVTRFDESLLNLLGGAWWNPPQLPAGWEREPHVAAHYREAHDIFSAAHPFQRWVWKDPRACLLMPFWDVVLGEMPRLIVLRNPLECAASLTERNEVHGSDALSLTHVYLRQAFRASGGRQTFVTAYDELTDDCRGWCERLQSFLAASDLRLDQPPDVGAVEAFVDPLLRHHRGALDLPAASGASPALTAFWEWALDKRGVHEALSLGGMPTEASPLA